MPSNVVGLYWLSWVDEDDNEIDVLFDDNCVRNKKFHPTNLFELTKRRIERRIRALWP